MKKSITKLLAPSLAAICSAVTLAACMTKSLNSAQEAVTAQNAVDNEMVSTAEKQNPAVDAFVVTIRQENWTLKWRRETQTFFCQQPQLTFHSVDADAINQEIGERCNRIFKALDSGEDMSNVSGGAEYKAYLNGEILSLVFIDRAVNNGYVKYLVYNIDVENGRRLNNAELLSRTGNHADVARANLTERVVEYFDNKVAKLPGKNDMSAQIAQAREATLSDEFLNMAQYYLADNNVLSASFAYKWVAGAKRYYDITEVFPPVS